MLRKKIASISLAIVGGTLFAYGCMSYGEACACDDIAKGLFTVILKSTTNK